MTDLATFYPLAPADRHRTIGSTDARRIARGEWQDLYLEKILEKQPEDLTHMWKPRLGLCTENLHAWWYAMKTGARLWEGHNAGNQRISRPGLPAHHATSIDRWIMDDNDRQAICTLELKHTNERASLRSSAEFYMAQLQWQLYVLGHSFLIFSIIRGNSEPEWGQVERDDEYINRLVRQVDEFWDCVENLEAPIEIKPDPALVTIAKTIKVNGYRGYDMEGNNEWAIAADTFVLDKIASEGLKASEARIKALVPADAGEISGHGVSFKRDARGALRLTIADEARSYAEKRLAALLGASVGA